MREIPPDTFLVRLQLDFSLRRASETEASVVTSQILTDTPNPLKSAKPPVRRFPSTHFGTSGPIFAQFAVGQSGRSFAQSGSGSSGRIFAQPQFGTLGREIAQLAQWDIGTDLYPTAIWAIGTGDCSTRTVGQPDGSLPEQKLLFREMTPTGSNDCSLNETSIAVRPLCSHPVTKRWPTTKNALALGPGRREEAGSVWPIYWAVGATL